MPTTLVLYRWRMRSETSGRIVVTRYHMSEQDALAKDPAAERIESSREVRVIPDDPEALSTSSWQRNAG